MKKYIVLAAAAIATLASCTKNEVAAPQSNEISFKALTVKAKKTKAIISDNIYPTTEGAFKVWAGYLASGVWADGTTATSYVDGATCTYDSATDLWVSDPKAFWPITGTLTFTAFAPASANPTYDIATRTITASGITANGQKEVFYSNPEDADNLTSSSTLENYVPEQGITNLANTGVPVVFQHALSQIVVSAKSGNELAKYKITSLVIKTKDTANLTLKENTAHTKYDVTWSEPSTNAVSSELADNTVEVVSSGYETVSKSGWLVMPQTLASDNENQILEIKYQMFYKNGGNWVDAGTTPDAITIPLYLKDSNGDVILDEFVAGKKYVLDLVISPKEIKYAPRVADWDSQEVDHYDVQ